jgi:hypothetical protein
LLHHDRGDARLVDFGDANEGFVLSHGRETG